MEENAYGITFSGEAYEYFWRACDELSGLTVDVKTVVGREFTAVVAGGAWDEETRWSDCVKLRAFSEDTAGPVGPIFVERVERIHVV